MKYSDLKTVILNQVKRNNRVSYLILGKPGGGKSALTRAVARELADGKNIPVVEFNASTRDPVDVLGTPNNRGDFTAWVPPQEFYELRQGVGKCVLILEELTDATVPMQNAMCRVILDRYAGNLKLSDELIILATGNRTEDKSGANRLTTKLGNRMRIHHFEENLEDWVDWAQDEEIDPVLIQFIRFKPKLLSDFDPSRPNGVNPTPRSWESVSFIDPALPQHLFFAECSGSVGEGAASEYASFRKVYANLVSFEDVCMAPKTVKVPKDLSALYATVGSCAHNVTVGNIERVADFVDRLPPEFSTMFWMDARKKDAALKGTKAFIKWATSSANVVLA